MLQRYVFRRQFFLPMLPGSSCLCLILPISYAAIIMSPDCFVSRYASSTNHSSHSIQQSICWKRKPTNGNFWLTHSVNIYECASHTWDFHTGNYALHRHVIYHHGLSNCTCCWHRIYWNTIPTICNGIVYPTINKS